MKQTLYMLQFYFIYQKNKNSASIYQNGIEWSKQIEMGGNCVLGRIRGFLVPVAH